MTVSFPGRFEKWLVGNNAWLGNNTQTPSLNMVFFVYCEQLVIFVSIRRSSKIIRFDCFFEYFSTQQAVTEAGNISSRGLLTRVCKHFECMWFPEKFGQNHLTPSEGSEVKTIQRLAGAVRLLVVFLVFLRTARSTDSSSCSCTLRVFVPCMTRLAAPFNLICNVNNIMPCIWRMWASFKPKKMPRSHCKYCS